MHDEHSLSADGVVVSLKGLAQPCATIEKAGRDMKRPHGVGDGSDEGLNGSLSPRSRPGCGNEITVLGPPIVALSHHVKKYAVIFGNVALGTVGEQELDGVNSVHGEKGQHSDGIVV